MRVEVHHVGKRFGAVHALRDVSFALPAGGRMALLGPNGAGKSTLTRVVMGMLQCEGEVLLDGCSAFEERSALARRLAYVPQVAPRLGATVREIVRAVSDLRGIDPTAIESVAGVLDVDLKRVGRRPFRDLSGGMRQKLLLALALGTGASLLILDEPTASLDADGRQRFFELIDGLPGAPSILLCSHRLEEIRHLVDRVLVLQDGAVAFDGSAADYLRRRARGVMEVKASDEAGDWLARRGFRRTAAGWWTAGVRNGDRVPLIAEMMSAMGGDVRDIVVRDLERLSGEEV